MLVGHDCFLMTCACALQTRCEQAEQIQPECLEGASVLQWPSSCSMCPSSRLPACRVVASDEQLWRRLCWKDFSVPRSISCQSWRDLYRCSCTSDRWPVLPCVSQHSCPSCPHHLFDCCSEAVPVLRLAGSITPCSMTY